MVADAVVLDPPVAKGLVGLACVPKRLECPFAVRVRRQIIPENAPWRISPEGLTVFLI